VAVYQVSGEYAALHYAAKHGVFELKTALFEVLKGFSRSGATIIISYFAPELMEWLPDH
jgi:porphobilinogen synthase